MKNEKHKKIEVDIASLTKEKQIVGRIKLIRGLKVILDSELASLYGVETRRLNEQVRRNKSKFPEDFMFQLSEEEYNNLRSQIAISSSNWGGRRTLPNVYTEYGALQAANVLNSQQASEMSVFIVRAFVKIRDFVLTNKTLARKVDELERKISDHDKVLQEIVKVIKALINDNVPDEKKKKIGYIQSDDLKKSRK